MTTSYPNCSAIGAEYIVGDRTFVSHTPRCLLADALQDEGRLWEAELLRRHDPIVLGRSIRLPNVGDVVEELHRLLPAVREQRCRLVGWSADHHDTVALIRPVRVGDADCFVGDDGTRWATPDTPRVYAALCTQEPWTRPDPALVELVLARTEVPMQHVSRNGDVFPFPPPFVGTTTAGAPGQS